MFSTSQSRSLATRIQRLNQAQLYVLTDGGWSADEFNQRITQLVSAGVDILQLRDKTLDDRNHLARARLLRSLTANTRTLFIVNDRADIALLSEADGVHVGQDEMTVQDVRRVTGPDCLVGVSTHTIEQAHCAVAENANYIGCGPTYPSATKQFASFPGTAFLREVAREVSLPAFAIGGISAENLPDVLKTGCRRIAISSAVTRVDDAVAAVRGLREQLLGKDNNFTPRSS